ncbi:MAG: hypothetical protein C3F02_01015 [Parcubacteria group bacterium]|nr:MAG: hypothetical protein C3F02_01015 [Parcubacteria group bacterium]
MKISEEIVVLYNKIKAIYQNRLRLTREENKIEVDEINSHLTSFYEKMRNSVDFKDIHLLRRFAIERNLKRRFILEALRPQIAKGLIEDMIRSNYIPNKELPESTIWQVEQIIAKYNQLYDLMNDLYHGDHIQDYFDWLIGVEACEIDMALKPESIEDAVIEAMYQVTKQRIKLKGGDDLTIQEKNIQVYIAIHKSLVKSDDTIISYHLLNLYFDSWLYADEQTIRTVAVKLPAIYHSVQRRLRHPYQRKILDSIKEPVVTFKILYELILAKGEGIDELLTNPDLLESEAKSLIHQRYSSIRKKISSASVRAILYIFLTKVLIAFVLELPYELYLIQHLNYLNLIINVSFPPILMFLVTLSVVPPSEANTKKILENLNNLVYGQYSQSILCQLKSKYRQTSGFQIFYYFMYSLLYILVFGVIIYFLRLLNFNIISGGIFIIFLSAVSFFALRIRHSAHEYLVIQKKEGLLSTVMNFFSLPVIGLGLWMSRRFKKINIFAFIMDYVVEVPLKLLFSAIEHWLGFMREKKEEVDHDNQS